MNRRQRTRVESNAATDLDVSSLVDICFLLLVYFLATSVILPRESDLDVAASGTRVTPIQFSVDPLLIAIEESGAICCGEGDGREVLDTDGGVRQLPLLLEQLAFYKTGIEAAGQEPLVVIEAADTASHQRVVDVLNALSESGIEKVSFRDPPQAW